jgi:hypothetical protein
MMGINQNTPCNRWVDRLTTAEPGYAAPATSDPAS